MHRDLGLQTGRGSLKVAVLDTIHGAEAIAEVMVDSGLDAEALEVYHHAPSIAGFDLVAAPVHLSPANPVMVEARSLGKRIITHHQAVGELLMPELSDSLQIFEVTGTHSKTSTALLLAKMLSLQEKVLSHTTRGLEIWSSGKGSALHKGLSITPGNVIRACKEAEAHSAEALISEISLGGTGLADCGILTGFSGDYRIAGGTRWASTAKLQMVSLAKLGAKLVASTDTRISADVTFGPGGQVRAEPDRMILGKDDIPVQLGPDLDFPGYQTALAASSAAAQAAGLDREDIAFSLQGFDGFSGRMKITRQQDLTVFDCSNSGLKVRDVALALDRAAGGRLAVVAGEESETVCEGMDIPALLNLLRQRRQEMNFLVLVGKRLQPWAEELEAWTAQDLAAGLEVARARFGPDGPDRLLSCVKCFR